MLHLPLWMLFGYLFGSFPTGYLLVRLFTGEDIRRHGSGNTGATNVARVLGRGWAIFTAIFDISKGWIAMCIASAIIGDASDVTIASVGAAAVLGHDFPVWLGFKGGKGVATTYGAIAYLGICPAVIGMGVWCLVRELTGYVSVSSIVGIASSAAALYLGGHPSSSWAAALFLLLLTTARHKENIKRLIAGTENKVERYCPKLLSMIKRI